jgi:hypothetical protein
MVNPKLIIVLLSSLLAGCVSVSEMRKMDKFEETSKAYEFAIRWSDFESASMFLKTEETANNSDLLNKLKQFKVTAYTIKNFLPSKDKSQVLLIAEISYFELNRLIVKSISDRQVWKYDTVQDRWLLTSGLPNLK